MEYKEFAKYYDKFYSKKDYQKEVLFLKNFINKEDKIIDIGCGTGMHGKWHIPQEFRQKGEMKRRCRL